MTIIDFNLFGSTTGLNAHPRVDLFESQQLDEAVAGYADELCSAPQFASAVLQVEEGIAEHPWPGSPAPGCERGAIMASVTTARAEVYRTQTAAHDRPESSSEMSPAGAPEDAPRWESGS